MREAGEGGREGLGGHSVVSSTVLLRLSLSLSHTQIQLCPASARRHERKL